MPLKSQKVYFSFLFAEFYSAHNIFNDIYSTITFTRLNFKKIKMSLFYLLNQSRSRDWLRRRRRMENMLDGKSVIRSHDVGDL